MKTILIIISIFFFGSISKEYHKAFFKNGILKEEGWLKKNIKTDYWYFYYENGNLKSEGHFENNLKNNWWVFYNTSGKIIHKCQLKNNVKNGYCLMYSNSKIESAQKYRNGKKIKEWFDFSSFGAENDLYELK